MIAATKFELVLGFPVCRNGFIQSDVVSFEPVESAIQKIVDYCEANPPTIDKRGVTVTSYKLKHVFERLLGTYISNGETIIAMNRLGYTLKRTNDGPNALVNIKSSWVYATDID